MLTVLQIAMQNSFQLAFFTWFIISHTSFVGSEEVFSKLILFVMQYKFGLRSCFHRRNDDIIVRLIPILCGYVTLPLYPLVTQVGTSVCMQWKQLILIKSTDGYVHGKFCVSWRSGKGSEKMAEWKHKEIWIQGDGILHSCISWIVSFPYP